MGTTRSEHELRYLSLHYAVEEFLAGRISRGDLFKTAHAIYSEYEAGEYPAHLRKDVTP